MKKVLAADEKPDFQSSLRRVCNSPAVDLKWFNSSMELLPLIAREQPQLIVVSIGLSDMNDFLMYDLLKKASSPQPVPVVATYDAQSAHQLSKYQKLKFQPDCYLKKPVSQESLREVISKYLGEVCSPESQPDLQPPPVACPTASAPEKPADTGASLLLGEEDGVVFTDVMSWVGANKDDSADLTLKKRTETPAFKKGVFQVSDGDKVDMGLADDTQKELAARVMSLQKQNEILRSENKRLSKENEDLKSNSQRRSASGQQEKAIMEMTVKNLEKKLEDMEAEFYQANEKNREELLQLQKQYDALNGEYRKLKEKKEAIGHQLEELSDKLTDKEREVIAKDHEFEKKLEREVEKFLTDTETRLTADYNQKIERLRLDIGRLENEKARIQNSFQEEMSGREELITRLQQKVDNQKSIQLSLESTIADVEREKLNLMEQIRFREDSISGAEKEKQLLNQRLASSESELTVVLRERDELNKLLAQKESDNRYHMDEKEELSRKLIESDNAWAAIRKENEELESRLNASREEIQSYRNQWEQKEYSFNQMLAELNQKIQAASEDIALYRQRLENIESMLEKTLIFTRSSVSGLT